MTQFWTRESALSSYLQFPRSLLNEDLHETEMLLYMVLLDRVRLSSIHDGWTDDNGHVFCRYSIENLAEDLHKSPATIKRGLKALEEKNLIKRVHEEGNRSTKIYVLIRQEQELKNEPDNGSTVSSYTAHKRATSKKERVRTREKDTSFLDPSYYTKGEIHGFIF